MTLAATCNDILRLACGRAAPDEGDARRAQLTVASALAALVLAALWGLAAGSRSAHLAAANLLKVPLVVLLSALCAAPAGLLALKLGGARLRGRDLDQSFTAGVLSGTLVLAVLAPVVALYTHTSVLVGGRLALGSVLLAIAVATLMFARHVRRQAPAGAATLLPVVVLVVMLLATLVQLVALASPILPEATPFDGGIDRLLPL